MKVGSSRLRTRTARSATALLLAGGLFLSGNTIASALDLGQLPIPEGALGSLGTASSDVHLAPTPRLASVPNFRDVAGNEGGGYEALAGRHLKRGVLYRANALSSASEEDLATLSSLNVTHIYDLRGQSEISNPMVGGPDKIPAGADYTHIPVEFGDLITLAQTIQSPEQGRQFMEDANRSFVTDPARREGFKQLLTQIAESDGPVLFHCSAGKDRTGWIAALLLSISGFPSRPSSTTTCSATSTWPSRTRRRSPRSGAPSASRPRSTSNPSWPSIGATSKPDSSRCAPTTAARSPISPMGSVSSR